MCRRNSWRILRTCWAPALPLCSGQPRKVFKQRSDEFTTVFEISVYGVGENRKSGWPGARGAERWSFQLRPGRRNKGKEKPSAGKSRVLSDSLGGKTEEGRTKPTSKSRPMSDKWSLSKPGESLGGGEGTEEETVSGSKLHGNTCGTWNGLLSTSRIMAAQIWFKNHGWIC